MCARLTMFTLGPGARAKAQELADAFAPQPKEDAEASVVALDSRLEEVLGGSAKGPPTLRGFEVYEPRIGSEG